MTTSLGTNGVLVLRNKYKGGFWKYKKVNVNPDIKYS